MATTRVVRLSLGSGVGNTGKENRTERHYASFFDCHYLSRGVALHRSLDRHSTPYKHWILCLDDETFSILSLLQLPHARLVRLSELECAYPALLQAKPTRSQLEYYWTCGPAFLLYVFERWPSVTMLTYVDADIFFFSDPSPIFAELGDGNIWLVEHRFPSDTVRRNEWSCRFNVGVLVFRRSEEGLACLQRWHVQCLEWCFDQHEPGRFGDQMYLNEWPELYGGVVISELPGVGSGFWNLDSYHFNGTGVDTNVDGYPLIYFHFTKLAQLSNWLYLQRRLGSYGQHLTGRVKSDIYAPYIRELRVAGKMVRDVSGRSDTYGTLRFSDGWLHAIIEMLCWRSHIAMIGRMVL